jgi:hypothetical protein
MKLNYTSQSGMTDHYRFVFSEHTTNGKSLVTDVFKRLVAQAPGIYVMNVADERSTVKRKDSSYEARELWWCYYELSVV